MAWKTNNPEWKMTEQEKLLARTEEVRANLESLVGDEAPVATEKPKPAKKTYDPGNPTVPVRLADGRYAIDSFRGEQKSYIVSLEGQGSCSCPHWTGRLAGTGLDCKHLKQARLAEWTRATERAKLVSDHALPILLEKYEAKGDLVAALALRGELLARNQAVSL
jgi:predicted nucleic acid-binding Zn finger protein